MIFLAREHLRALLDASSHYNIKMIIKTSANNLFEFNESLDYMTQLFAIDFPEILYYYDPINYRRYRHLDTLSTNVISEFSTTSLS